MRKRIVSCFLCIAMTAGYGFSIQAADGLPDKGDKINGFTVTDVREFDLTGDELITFEHDKTGGTIIYIASDDIDRAFNISFRTPPQDDTGLTHVFEHSALSGSEKYPSRTLTFNLMSQSYITYMNATTANANTSYMISSLSDEQLYNLADYYLSGVFDTLIYTDPSIKEREAWHYELESPEDELTLSGTVYSEMQGYGSIINAAYINAKRAFYPGSPVSYNAGGDPEFIPELENEDMMEYHTKYYTPSNCLTTLYGDIDYEKYLTLFDSYFSEYDRQDIEIELSANDDTPNFIDETYSFPASSGTDTSNQSVMYYMLECEGMNVEDYVSASALAAVLNSFVLPDITAQKLPGASVSCTIDWSTYETPAFMFIAVNVDPEDKETLMDIASDALAQTTSLDEETLKVLTEQTRLSAALATETKNLGVTLASTASVFWGVSGDPYLYYDLQNASLDESNYDFRGIADKYLNGRKGIITTVPEAGLLEKKQAETKEKLAEIKASMADDEINSIVEATKEYKNASQAGVSEEDKKYIDEINTVTVDDLSSNIKSYPVTDTNENGIRYVTVEADKPELTRGRIMLDVSDFTAEETAYLRLYQNLAGNLDTDYHSYNDFALYASQYGNISTDIMTLTTDNGFTPYLIVKWQNFAEYSDKLFDIADELLFHTKLDDITRMKYILSQLISSYEIGFEQTAPYNLMLSRAMAMYDKEIAYNYYIDSLEFLSFLRETNETLDSDPESVISALESIKTKLHNKDGAAVLCAGTKANTDLIKESSKKFFENIPSSEKTAQDLSSLLLPESNEALEINSSVNYNGIYMPIDDGEYSGKLKVLSALLSDSYCIPQLRNKHNIYSILMSFDEDGIGIVTYRDPNIKSTFDEYSGIADYLRSGDITQDMVDNYIKSIYSQYVNPSGELDSAYWYADSYMDGEELDYQTKMISDIKSSTAADMVSYADLLEKWYNDGVKFTAASPDAIDAASDMFDKRLSVSGGVKDVTIIINGETLTSPVAPYIENDITMVPMRAIFEALGAEVEWNEAERMVTAVKDDITLTLVIGKSEIVRSTSDGIETTVTAENPAVIVEDRTMIPARVISELLGCDVQWNDALKTVTINYQQ